jgi:predicted dehydrogenase
LGRRGLLRGAALGTTLLAASRAVAFEPSKHEAAGNVLRVGVVSASIRGKPQPGNGHTWHFAQYFHPTIDLDAFARYKDPGSAELFRKHVRNPAENFGQLPFPDTVISHVYDADQADAAKFAETFPGVEVASSLEQLIGQVDAVWMGDASGFGDDHFDLVAPGLARGLPTFCDKPLGGTVEQTRKILDFARQHNAPIMSSSLYRHQWGTEEALRRRDSGDFGSLQYVICSQGGGYTDDGWLVYGQHPVWMVVTLCGPTIQAVNLYAYANTAHALVTYADRPPAEVWYGRPDVGDTYCESTAHFDRETYLWTPAIEGNYWFGHHYQMFNMARAFREMIRTRQEPVPHEEMLAVTAVIHAAVKSRGESSRLVDLAEVLG